MLEDPLGDGLQVADCLVRLIQVVVLLWKATHGGDLLAVDLVLLVGVLVEGSGGVVPYVRDVDHLLVVTLLDVWNGWHHGTDQALSAPFSYGYVYAVR